MIASAQCVPLWMHSIYAQVSQMSYSFASMSGVTEVVMLPTRDHMKVTNLLPLLFGLLLANGYRIKALWNRRILFDTPCISYCQPYGVKAFSPLPVYFLFCFCDMDILMLIACSGKTYRKKRINYQLINEVVQHDYKCKEQNWSWKHTFLLFISMKVFQGLRINSFFLILLSNLPNEDNTISWEWQVL